jgi:hypothetical protein
VYLNVGRPPHTPGAATMYSPSGSPRAHRTLQAEGKPLRCPTSTTADRLCHVPPHQHRRRGPWRPYPRLFGACTLHPLYPSSSRPNRAESYTREIDRPIRSESRWYLPIREIAGGGTGGRTGHEQVLDRHSRHKHPLPPVVVS